MLCYQVFISIVDAAQPLRLSLRRSGRLFAATAALFGLLIEPGSARSPERLISDDGARQFDPDLVVAPEVVESLTLPRAFQTATLDMARLADVLELRGISAGTGWETWDTIELPMPDGSFIRLHVWEDSFLSPEMQGEHPHIRIYAGRGADDPSITARLDLTLTAFTRS